MDVFTKLRTKLPKAFALMLASLIALPGIAQATEWNRLAGPTAYETMQEVVQSRGAFNAGNTDTVIVATGDGYWDALSASGLAGRLQAPVLITPTNSLAHQTRSELERLQPSRVVMVGGPAALNDSVKSEIEAMGIKVDRVAGSIAADTAVEIWKAGAHWSTTAIIATSNGYWDALSIAPYAFAKSAPIFLTGADNKLSDSTLSAIKSGGFSRIVIVGGTAAVSQDVENQLAGYTIKRLAGPIALDTSAQIATWELGEGMSAEGISVATGEGYWDALTGAAVAGKNNSILVLANTYRYQAIDAAIGAPSTSNVRQGYVFGGTAAVSDFTLAYLNGEFSPASLDDSPDKSPASDDALMLRGSLNIQTALDDSFSHGPKTSEYQKYIVLHDTEELLDPLGIVDMWRSRNDGEVATHFVIGRDGSVVQCVPLDRIAYHAGVAPDGFDWLFEIYDDGRASFSNSSYDSAMNAWSVGIELCHVGTTGTGHAIEPDYPEAQLRALDRVIAYIDEYYGMESGIIDHKTWTPDNPDCSAEFEQYLANYQTGRTHDGQPLS